MNSSSKLLLVCCALLLCAHVSFAQESPAGTASATAVPDTVIEKIPFVVTGVPYSSITESETIQTGDDGTRFDRKAEKMKTYRDSQGRTRTERYMPSLPSKSDPEEVLTVTIRDPVAGFEYFLNPRDHTARRKVLHAPRENAESNGSVVTRLEARSRDDRPHPKITVEDLGTQVMDGLVVAGKRTTMAFPADFDGNDRPFDVVNERWFSKELETNILTVTNDPRSGEHKIKTTIINRAEPDPALFEVPADYTISEMPAAKRGPDANFTFPHP